MSYTVEEAKTKWCPMKTEFIKVCDITKTKGSNCVADGCMAWRWIYKYETVQFGYYETKIALIPNYRRINTKTDKGYCSMFRNTEHTVNTGCPMS